MDVIVIVAVVGGRWWWRHRAERQLADTELWLSPYGAGYRCAAGYFEVPWSAVRRIGFENPPGGAHTAILRACRTPGCKIATKDHPRKPSPHDDHRLRDLAGPGIILVS